MQKIIIRINHYTFGIHDVSVQDMDGYEYLEKYSDLDETQLKWTISSLKFKYPQAHLCTFKY